ncbi:glycosyltransferase family 32 protein [Leuconostoc lactis]|uniref:glycosyltransferase family 32 protein n=1 Tax=Leuconostoc lactis TaxID=1246 RepID=UPI003745E26B
MIPKNIYYTWFGGAVKSDQVLSNIRKWQSLNPDYKIIEINESNFDVSSTDFSRDAYKQKEWAFVSDVARLAIIYEFGGYYFDTDVELLKPLSIFSKYHEVYGLQNSGEINTGSGFGAEPKSELVAEQLETYKQLKFDSEHLHELTNVAIVSRIFKKRGLKVKNQTQMIGDAIVLKSTYLTPLHFWGGGSVRRETVGIHHFHKTWGTNVKTSLLGKISLNLRLKIPCIEKFISNILFGKGN